MDVEVDDVRGELTTSLPGNGKLIIVDGNDGLENLHGTGLVELIEGTIWLQFTVTINTHWDPLTTKQ